MISAPRQFVLLVGKDLRIESRSRQTLGLVIVLGLLIIVVLGMGLGANGNLAGFNATAVLWVAYLFSGVLCFEKTFSVERADSALAALLMAPVDRGVIYLAKLASNLLLMLAVAAVITPAGILFFNFDLSIAPLSFATVMVLSLIGFAAVGTLFSALVSSTRLQGGLLAMMVFPVTLPLVLASTHLLIRVFRDGVAPGGDAIGIIVAFDVMFLAVSWLVFDWVLEPQEYVMLSPTRNFARLYWLVTLVLLAFAAALLGVYTPTEATMGPIQKIFYPHLSCAISTFLACFICFVASIGYLGRRTPGWDDLASSAAKVAVELCTIVLITGMIWGRSAWGRWWTWSPRLTFSLVLWLLYAVYLLIRGSVESPQRRALIGAVYGVIAFLDVPLVWLSVRLMPDIHPTSVTLAPAMKLTLIAWFAPVLLLTGGLIAAGCATNRRWRAARNLASDSNDTPAPMRWAGGVS